MENAALRGIDVRIITPHISEKKRFGRAVVRIFSPLL